MLKRVPAWLIIVFDVLLVLLFMGYKMQKNVAINESMVQEWGDIK